MRKLIALVLAGAVLPAFAESPQRIVSVGGSITETIYALGRGDRLAGADTTSYYPAAAGTLPKVGYMRALSVEGVLSLRPDLLILSDEAGPPPVVAQLRASGLNVRTLPSARQPADVADNIRQLGEWLDAGDEARALIRALEKQRKQLAGLTTGNGRRRVLFVMHHGSSPMAAGRETSADSIIRLSGADNAVTAYAGYKPLTPEAAVTASPDVILTTRQSLDQVGGTAELLRHPALALTPAGRAGNVIAMDALLLLGFGPRTLEAAIELARRYP